MKVSQLRALPRAVGIWLRRYALILVIPPAMFLLGAGVTRQVRDALQGARFQNWREDYSAAVAAGFRGQREEALQRMAKAAAAAPEDAAVHSELAMGFRKLGGEGKALKHVEKVLELRSEELEGPTAFLGIVGAHIRRGDWAQAKRILNEQVLSRWPDSAEAHYYKGLIILETGKGPDAARMALEHFEECLQKKPDDIRALYHKGLCHLRLEQAEKAATILRTVVERKPRFSGAYHDLGDALRRMGEEEEAAKMLATFQKLESQERRIRHLETQVSLDRMEANELSELAALYADLERYEEAEHAWARFTRLEPVDPKGYRGLAEASRALGKQDESARAQKLAEALEKLPVTSP